MWVVVVSAEAVVDAALSYNGAHEPHVTGERGFTRSGPRELQLASALAERGHQLAGK